MNENCNALWTESATSVFAAWGDPAWWHVEATAPTLALTADGEAVLNGTADHIALNGIDRWLGGVHVTTASPWRWDEAHQSLREGV